MKFDILILSENMTRITDVWHEDLCMYVYDTSRGMLLELYTFQTEVVEKIKAFYVE